MTFTPQSLPNSSGTLTVHWAARLDTGYSNNDPVGTFNAQSGTSFDADQATGADQPTYKTDIINGQPVYRFDGTDFLTSGAAADWKFLHDGTGFTAFVVFSFSAADPDDVYLLLDTAATTSANTGVSMFMDDRVSVPNNETLRLLIGKGSATFPIIDLTTSDDAVWPGSVMVATFHHDLGATGNDAGIYSDGLLVGSAESANLPQATGNPDYTLHVGRLASGSSFFMNGDIAEILIYSGALGDTDRRYVEDGLRDIYYQGVPNRYGPIDEAGDYDALGMHVVRSDGEIHYYGRRGTIHGLEKAGKIRKWSLSPAAGVWAQEDIADHADYDDRNVGGGIVPATDTHMLFYGRYDVDGTAWLDIRALRATDGGDTWSDRGAMSVGSDTTFSPYGPLVELPSGNLLQSFYADDGTNYRAYTLLSSDDGATWGSSVDIDNSTTILITETACVYVSGTPDGSANLLAVAKDNAGVMRQYKSVNGGISWTDMGVLPFSSGTNKDVSPWLYDDGSYIHLLYADRTEWKLVHVWGVAADLLSSVNNWINPQYIHNFQNTTAGDQGYPSMSLSGGQFQIMFHDDSTDTADESDIYRVEVSSSGISGGMARLGLHVFKDATENVMIADWTNRATPPIVETGPHGYASMSATVEMTTDEAFRFYDGTPVAHVVLGDGAFRVFEGRIEDRPIGPGRFGFTGFGYARALHDVKYSALWSTKRYDKWTLITEEDSANFVPAMYELSKDNRLYIAPRITTTSAETGTFGDGVDKGGWLAIAAGNRQIKELYIEYDVNLPTNWKARILSFDEPIFTSVTEEWSVTTSGSSSATVTFSTARDGIEFEVVNDTGGDSTPTGDTGDYYAKLTQIRAKTTEGDASGHIHADEIAKALVDHVTTIIGNSGQLNTSTALIDNPNIDLDEVDFADADGDVEPGDILTWLATLGDDSDPVEQFQWQVWEDQKLRFQKRGTGAQEWHIDLADFDINSTLDELRNSVYGTYRDERGDIRRTAVVEDAASIAKYGITRRTNVRSPDTNTTPVTTYRNAFLEDHKDITPRAWIRTFQVFTSSGAGPVPIYLVRAGDNCTIRNLPPTGSSVVDKIRHFRIHRTILDCGTGELIITPELESPSLTDTVAALSKAAGV